MMRQRDLAELFALAAIWGGSFLFMRVSAPEFGAFALAGLRVIGASLVLLPLLAMRGEMPALLKHWRPILAVGVMNSALPFLCFGFAAMHLTAGLMSIFNAATPLFGAAIAWVWLKDTLTPSRIAGLLIGFLGVFGLAWSKAALSLDAEGLEAALAVGACLLATLSYGWAANASKKFLAGVPPMASAAGSQLGAAVVLAVPAAVMWPAAMPAAGAWLNVVLLAVVCTGVAYVLYFRLIANVGPANAITVTFLIPAFAVVWGGMFLGERITPPMAVGCAVILLGTSLATGFLQQRWAARRAVAGTKP